MTKTENLDLLLDAYEALEATADVTEAELNVAWARVWAVL